MTPATAAGPNRTATIRIVAAADRGMGLGHLDGKVVFVPCTAPGDLLEVVVVRERPRYLEARTLRILEGSPLRREPPCPHFGPCGGCQWQHLPYPEQLAAKVGSFEGFLKGRLGLGRGREDRFLPPIGSPQEWGYRNRVGLKVRAIGDSVQVGYFAQGSHRLVAVERCPIAHPAIQAFLSRLRRFLPSFSAARAALPQVDLQVDGGGGLWTVFHMLRPPTPGEKRSLEGFARDASVTGTSLQTGRKHTLSPLVGAAGPMPFRVRAEGRELAMGVTPGGFVQANPAVNQALVDQAISLADHYAGRPALDLYCGAGNFTLPLALRAASVVGVEGYPPAARDARANAQANGFQNVRILAQPAAEGLIRLASEGFRPTFALLDPPREGMAEAIDGLSRLCPERILYVSCAPPTLARDLKALFAFGYRLEWVRAADMFPQTAHLEALALLRRGPGPGT